MRGRLMEVPWSRCGRRIGPGRGLVAPDPGDVSSERCAQEEIVDAVVVEDLRKSYGATRAVAGVSFTVRYGEIFSLLWPDGAGKTAMLGILAGSPPADDGKGL